MDEIMTHATILVQGEPHDVFEVYTDITMSQTMGFVFDESIGRLLNAAPELLEALENIIDSGEIPYCESDKLVRAAKAAIAKAKGTQ